MLGAGGGGDHSKINHIVLCFFQLLVNVYIVHLLTTKRFSTIFSLGKCVGAKING